MAFLPAPFVPRDRHSPRADNKATWLIIRHRELELEGNYYDRDNFLLKFPLLFFPSLSCCNSILSSLSRVYIYVSQRCKFESPSRSKSCNTDTVACCKR